MTARIRSGDRGTVIYINVHDLGVSLDDELGAFTTRTINLIRPDGSTVVITTVTVEEDAFDSIEKLKIRTGADTGTTLTGVGDFAVSDSYLDYWIGEVILADSSGLWTSDPFLLFQCLPTLV